MTHEQQTSPTAAAMEHLELYGGHTARRGMDEPDQRGAPDEETVQHAWGDILDIIDGLAQDTKLEDSVAEIASSMATSLHYMLQRVLRTQDDVQSEIRQLTRDFDGSEITDIKIQQQTNLMHDTDARVDMLEMVRDKLVEHIAVRYQQSWHPPRGNHISRRNATASIVEARDVLKAIADKTQSALIVEGTLVGFAGGKDFQDMDCIWQYLDRVKERYGDMVLVHGGGPGAEKIASKWADHRRVKQIICTPDWKAHNKAAPFRRNDEMLKLELVGLIATPGGGITDNLVDKATKKNIKVKRLGQQA